MALIIKKGTLAFVSLKAGISWRNQLRSITQVCFDIYRHEKIWVCLTFQDTIR